MLNDDVKNITVFMTRSIIPLNAEYMSSIYAFVIVRG